MSLFTKIDNQLTRIAVGRGAGPYGMGVIHTSHIANEAVTTPKIARGAVNTEKLLDYAVTEIKLLSSSVSSRTIQANAVKTQHINDHAVLEQKIGDQQVSTRALANRNVTQDKIGLQAVNEEHFNVNLQGKFVQNNFTYYYPDKPVGSDDSTFGYADFNDLPAGHGQVQTAVSTPNAPLPIDGWWDYGSKEYPDSTKIQQVYSTSDPSNYMMRSWTGVAWTEWKLAYASWAAGQI
jgi:hypothetical protein